MECKLDSVLQNQFCSVELIDTLWNVNTNLAPSCSLGGFELIDTLWNVNSKTWFLSQIMSLGN